VLSLSSFPVHAKLSQFDHPLTKMNMESFKGCIPVRQSGLHVCYPPSFVFFLWPIFKLFMRERLRKRVHMHSGSTEKVMKHMAAFGLPRESIPTDVGGEAEVDHLSWLEHRRTCGL
jgi:hypothetical protein